MFPDFPECAVKPLRLDELTQWGQQERGGRECHEEKEERDRAEEELLQPEGVSRP